MSHSAVLDLKPLLDVHEMSNSLELGPFGFFRPPCQGTPLQGLFVLQRMPRACDVRLKNDDRGRPGLVFYGGQFSIGRRTFVAFSEAQTRCPHANRRFWLGLSKSETNGSNFLALIDLNLYHGKQL